MFLHFMAIGGNIDCQIVKGIYLVYQIEKVNSISYTYIEKYQKICYNKQNDFGG